MMRGQLVRQTTMLNRMLFSTARMPVAASLQAVRPHFLQSQACSSKLQAAFNSRAASPLCYFHSNAAAVKPATAELPKEALDASQNVTQQPSASRAAVDLFPAKNEKLDLKAHLISDARADARHFREHELAVSACQNKLPDHFRGEAQHNLPHPIWTADAVHGVQITHYKPEGISDRLAYYTVKTLRTAFDILSGYSLGRIDERGWLTRIAYLETVAGVPGMVGAMVRHLTSLRRMSRDCGWIHTLLEEAENERMHLMTTLVLKKPSALFRAGVLITQALFLGFFTICYLTSPKFAHRFVGYLEEEAVVTYTKLLAEIDHGHLPLFHQLPAPPVARDYWCLSEDATFRDVILAIRADESHHREVNHTFAGLQVGCPNPFPPGH